MSEMTGVATGLQFVLFFPEKKLVPLSKVSYIEQITDDKVRVYVGDFLSFEATGDLEDMTTLIANAGQSLREQPA